MSMMPLTAALVITHRGLWEQTHSCIQNLPVRIALEQTQPDDAEGLLERIERHRTDVVLIEAGQISLPLDEFIGRLRDSSSQPAVFVLHPEASPRHIIEALRAGAAEFLYPPLVTPLREAFERLSATRSRNATAASNGLGRVFGFISARGGCGATTFACHAATSAARQTKQQVLLADFDFEAGLVRFIMKSKGTYSVRDAVNNMHRMDANFWKALVSRHSERLDVIPSPEDLAAKEQPQPQEIAHLMRFLRSVYPMTVVDFGRYQSAAAIASLPEVEKLFVVISPDLGTLGQAKDCVNALTRLGFESERIKVLLNRVPDRGIPDTAGIEKFIGVPVAGSFNNESLALYEAWSEGRLLESGSRLSRQLDALAASFSPREPAPVVAAPANPKSLFTRLFASRSEGI